MAKAMQKQITVDTDLLNKVLVLAEDFENMDNITFEEAWELAHLVRQLFQREKP